MEKEKSKPIVYICQVTERKVNDQLVIFLSIVNRKVERGK